MTKKNLNKELEKYYEIVNMLDDMALGNREVDTNLLEEKARKAGLLMEDIADANDCHGNSWEEIIEELKELHKTGWRVKVNG